MRCSLNNSGHTRRRLIVPAALCVLLTASTLHGQEVPTIALEDEPACGGSATALALAVELGRRLPNAEIMMSGDGTGSETWTALWATTPLGCDLWLVREGEAYRLPAVVTDSTSELRDVAIQLAWFVDGTGEEEIEIENGNESESENGSEGEVAGAENDSPPSAETDFPREEVFVAMPEPSVDSSSMFDRAESPDEVGFVEADVAPEWVTAQWLYSLGAGVAPSTFNGTAGLFINGRLGIFQRDGWALSASGGALVTEARSRYVYVIDSTFDEFRPRHQMLTSALHLERSFGGPGPLSWRTGAGVGPWIVTSTGSESWDTGVFVEPRVNLALAGEMTVGLVVRGGAGRVGFDIGARGVSPVEAIGPDALGLSGFFARLTVDWLRGRRA